MKKKITSGLILALACLTLVGLAACGRGAETEQQVVKVIRGDIMVSVSADGNLSLLQHQKLTFGTSGTIAEISVKEGDQVTEGQVLARLDTTSLELAVKAAELAVSKAEIDLEVATNSFNQLTAPYPYVTFRFVIPESVDAVRIAQLQIKEAQEELRKGLAGEPYSIAEVKEKLRKAQEVLTDAEAKLARGSGAGVHPRSVDYWTLRAAQLTMEKAQVTLDDANNDLDEARDQLKKAVITAPFDGVAAGVEAKEGDMLSSVTYATETIIELVDPGRMELNAEVDEIDVPDVSLGQRAILSFDALPDLQLVGEVTSIASLSTEEAGLVLYEVKITFDVPDGSGLRSGMTAGADIISDERSDVLVVPTRVIGQDSSGNSVVKVVVDGQIQERVVVIGISDGFRTEVLEGLTEGEMVLTETGAG